MVSKARKSILVHSQIKVPWSMNKSAVVDEEKCRARFVDHGTFFGVALGAVFGRMSKALEFVNKYHTFVGRYIMRQLHKSDLLRCFRNSGSVTYVSTLSSPSSSAPCISSFVQSLCRFAIKSARMLLLQHSHYYFRTSSCKINLQSNSR